MRHLFCFTHNGHIDRAFTLEMKITFENSGTCSFPIVIDQAVSAITIVAFTEPFLFDI